MMAVVVQISEMAVAGMPMSGSVSSFLSATKPEMTATIKKITGRVIIKWIPEKKLKESSNQAGDNTNSQQSQGDF